MRPLCGVVMIDLHCHILPGVDDGAPSPDISLAMAALGADEGITTIVATPHCNTRDPRKNYKSAALSAAFRDLQDAVRAAGVPIRLLPGCEVLLRGDVGRLLDTQRLYTLAGSRYLLVEFYFDERPEVMDAALRTVRAHGYVPVVAHPERYFCVQDRPEMAARWYERGDILQLNKGSILGDLGERAYDVSRDFLRRGLCHVIASDAHHAAFRTPSFSRLLNELEYHFPAVPADLLLEENPRIIIQNQTF